MIAALLLALALPPSGPRPSLSEKTPEPLAGPLSITVALASPVLGVDQESELRIDLGEDVPAPRVPPRVTASAGRVDELVKVGPRSFIGRYVLPAERFPQVAILLAELADPFAGGRPLRAFTMVRLRAAASPAFHTDPGAAVTLRIGDKEFGPIRAQRDGTVRVPVVVPPGVGFGVARSVNQFGESTEQTVDLRIPPFRRVMLVAPHELPAGTTQEMAVYAVDASGLPVDPGAISLQTSAGRPQPLGGRPGEARFLVKVPATSAAPLHLEGGLREQPEAKDVADVPVLPGPTRHLVLRPDRARLPAAAGSSLRVYLAGEDQFGNSTDPAGAAVLVDGALVPTRAEADGQVTAVVSAPPDRRRDHVEVEAVLGNAYARRRIPVGSPVSFTRPDVGPPHLTITPRAGVLLDPDRPPGASARLEVLGRGQTWPAWLLVGMGVGLMTTELRASDGLGISEIDLLQVPVMALARYQRRIGRAALGAELGAGAIWSRVSVDSFGHEVAGHRLSPAAEVGADAAADLGAGQVVVGLRYLLATVGKLSSGDRLLGQTGGLVLDLGFRLGW
jgi:hypothetical protein